MKNKQKKIKRKSQYTIEKIDVNINMNTVTLEMRKNLTKIKGDTYAKTRRKEIFFKERSINTKEEINKYGCTSLEND